jgi:hypothetical protein
MPIWSGLLCAGALALGGSPVVAQPRAPAARALDALDRAYFGEDGRFSPGELERADFWDDDPRNLDRALEAGGRPLARSGTPLAELPPPPRVRLDRTPAAADPALPAPVLGPYAEPTPAPLSPYANSTATGLSPYANPAQSPRAETATTPPEAVAPRLASPPSPEATLRLPTAPYHEMPESSGVTPAAVAGPDRDDGDATKAPARNAQ